MAIALLCDYNIIFFVCKISMFTDFQLSIFSFCNLRNPMEYKDRSATGLITKPKTYITFFLALVILE